MAGGFIELDSRELNELELDLAGAPLRIQYGAVKVLRRAGSVVDAGMRIDASGHRYLSNLPQAVSHEMRGPLEVEIGLGPDNDQGSLAHIIVYGSVNNAPVYDHTAALRRNMPAIMQWFGIEAEDAVLGFEHR